MNGTFFESDCIFPKQLEKNKHLGLRVKLVFKKAFNKHDFETFSTVF